MTGLATISCPDQGARDRLRSRSSALQPVPQGGLDLILVTLFLKYSKSTSAIRPASGKGGRSGFEYFWNKVGGWRI